MILEQHVAGLREERQRLQAEAKDAKATLQELEEQLQRIDTALAALTGSERVKKKKSGGNGLKTKEVIAEMTALLQGGELQEDELAKRVADSLKSKGKTRTGLALRFKQAVQHESFVKNGDALALAQRRQA